MITLLKTYLGSIYTMGRKRIAVIDYKKCKPDECGRACIKICPVNRQEKECIYEEPGKIVRISEELCTGCGICPKICPFGAISIINLELDLQNPIHQYGKNRFRLFRMPVIKKDETVGLIGKNGIGKSTIIKILSGSQIPNLGNYDEQASLDKVIEYYKGKDAQKIFSGLKDNTFKISYKPQNVELLALAYSGLVSDLLNKIGTKERIEELQNEFGLKNILNKNIKTLSGGELQKVAIVATMLKDASVYFYDEPSSFLDIKQRFTFANIMHKYQKTNMIVEHDLALLDYLSDYLHVIFGKPHAYGVISNIKSTNIAINEFLEGFIKDENLRFRNYQIEFVYNDENSMQKRDIFLEYPDMEKSYPGFELKINSGTLYNGDVIGILGENGIGKSTFVKMLAGIEKSSTNIDKGFEISYKPQSIMLNEQISDVTVREYLKDGNQDVLKTELWGKLSIDAIKDYKLSELNGGDLQKVFICKTLAKDADIYLIDEPSAFLDVEERLNVAKAIKNVVMKSKKVAFVVDHDILFIEYLSDKIIVFEGEPGVKGLALAPQKKIESMNHFLKILGVTYRQDPSSKRPRINKLGSTKDQEQKKSGNYYIY